MSASSSRLKREDCSRTKHDSVFSNWKILVGPSDWEDHLLGKEGATRYRIHNLPKSLEPGVYELGIAVSHSTLGRNISKLDPYRIVVVYLGQAVNIRSRLQSYGQSGSHLVQKSIITKSDGHSDDTIQNGSGLFGDIFSRGYPIVFRWAPMQTKKEAIETEARLLQKFDYAWNKECNDSRRPYDIHKKLNKVSAASIWFPKIARVLQKQVGIRIESRKSHPSDKNNNPFSGILNFSKSRPRYNQGKPNAVDVDSNVNSYYKPETDDEKISLEKVNICGVILEDGTQCRKQPVPARKRCQEHKGKRIQGPVNNGSKEGKPSDTLRKDKNGICLETKIQSDQDQRRACGVRLVEGEICSKPTVAGRKRCQEHKGLRIMSLVTKA